MNQQKYVLVTGASGQIGSVVVQHLSTAGFKVIGVDSSPPRVGTALSYEVDLRNVEEIDRLFEDIKGLQITAAIQLAGVSVFDSFEDRTVEDIDWVLDVNVRANILITQRLVRYFFSHLGFGNIINIGSIYGSVAGDMRLYEDGDRRTPEIYGASKAAVINLTQYFAAYLANQNVRVNCISPGGIFNSQAPNFVKKYSNKVPMNRMGEAAELLSTVDYFMDERSSYTTGQNIFVDGGLTSW